MCCVDVDWESDNEDVVNMKGEKCLVGRISGCAVVEEVHGESENHRIPDS
jgi:hypothetical protein